MLHPLKLTANAPENRGPLEKEIPSLDTTIFRGELLVSGSVIKMIPVIFQVGWPSPI